MLKIIYSYIKKDWVFTIATTLAIVTMILVPPNIGYIRYIDFNVLGILFCLMCVVAGFKSCGLLEKISQQLLQRAKGLRDVSIILVLLCFFSSMLLTNDVALIAFVPLTLVTLREIPSRKLIYLVSVETMAANLGSMLTPIGNPQNLYLYTRYEMGILDFMKIVVPITIASLILLLLLVGLGKNTQIQREKLVTLTLDPKALRIFTVLFLICLLSVLRMLDYKICVLITVATLWIVNKSLLKKVDYMLLGTFVAFFIIVGNLGELQYVRTTLETLMAGRELWTTVLASQVISNVPAAIMLSGFTENAQALILGSNIGGLGTLVASLASLISYKLYAKSEGAKPLHYLGVFTLLNVGMLGSLSLLAKLWYF